MPVQRANLGGMFGSGVTAQPSRAPDYGAMIEGLANGASSLLHGAYLRKLGEQNRQAAIAQAAQAAQDRRDTIAIAQQREAREGQTASDRLAFDREKLTTESAARDAETARRTAELGAKGIRLRSSAVTPGQSVDPSAVLGSGMPEDGAPPIAVPESLDASHYEDLGGGYVYDRQHNPDATRLTEEKSREDAADRRSAAQIAAADRRAAASNATTLAASRERADSPRKDFADEAKLSGEYNHTYPVESADKFSSNAVNALAGVALARKGNREGQLMAITGFLRQTHPDAVVRTNDKGMLLEVQGVPAGVEMQVRRMFGQGGLLTPAALNEIESATHAMIDQQRRGLDPTKAFYGQRAREAGLDSAHVVRDPFGALPATGASDPDAAARAALTSDPGFAAFVRQQRGAPAPPAPRLRVPGRP